MADTIAPPNIRVHTAGFSPHFVPYRSGLELQATAVSEIRAGSGRGTVFVLEHEAVYTAGRRSLEAEYPNDGTPVVPVDRGGKVTWHGPGQLVVYPVIRLREKYRVVEFVRLLEQGIIDAAAEFGAVGVRVEGRSGVWSPAAAPDETDAKFAQVGLHTSDGIVTHGIAINCANSLEPFANFVPCGITDAGVTTLSALVGHTVTPEELAPVLIAHLTPMIEEVAA